MVHASHPSPAVSFADVERASTGLTNIALRTPVLHSRTVDRTWSTNVSFKCEGFQRSGSFKFRGAFTALSRLDAAARARGVLTYSSGNHAQALALAGSLLDIRIHVVMPADAPAVKRAAAEDYGAEIISYDRSQTSREALARKIAAESGMAIIPPYDHPDIIAGQGTAALELIEETGPLDLLLVPCGGGGLLSGSSISARKRSPGCRVIGVEPKAGDDGARSFRTRTLQTVDNPDTIADGARTPSLGQLTFPIILENVSDVVTVSDDHIRFAMRYMMERMKVVVEPTGALGFAALTSGAVDVMDKKVGVIVSGANVDTFELSDTLRGEPSTMNQ